MKRAATFLIPAALFVGWWWMIIGMINDMSQQQASDRLHAMIVGCQYKDDLAGTSDVIVFICDGEVKLHQRVNWK